MGDKILSKYAIKETLGIIILYFAELLLGGSSSFISKVRHATKHYIKRLFRDFHLTKI